MDNIQYTNSCFISDESFNQIFDKIIILQKEDKFQKYVNLIEYSLDFTRLNIERNTYHNAFMIIMFMINNSDSLEYEFVFELMRLAYIFNKWKLFDLCALILKDTHVVGRKLMTFQKLMNPDDKNLLIGLYYFHNSKFIEGMNKFKKIKQFNDHQIKDHLINWQNTYTNTNFIDENKNVIFDNKIKAYCCVTENSSCEYVEIKTNKMNLCICCKIMLDHNSALKYICLRHLNIVCKLCILKHSNIDPMIVHYNVFFDDIIHDINDETIEQVDGYCNDLYYRVNGEDDNKKAWYLVKLTNHNKLYNFIKATCDDVIHLVDHGEIILSGYYNNNVNHDKLIDHFKKEHIFKNQKLSSQNNMLNDRSHDNINKTFELLKIQLKRSDTRLMALSKLISLGYIYGRYDICKMCYEIMINNYYYNDYNCIRNLPYYIWIIINRIYGIDKIITILNNMKEKFKSIPYELLYNHYKSIDNLNKYYDFCKINNLLEDERYKHIEIINNENDTNVKQHLREYYSDYKQNIDMIIDHHMQKHKNYNSVFTVVKKVCDICKQYQHRTCGFIKFYKCNITHNYFCEQCFEKK